MTLSEYPPGVTGPEPEIVGDPSALALAAQVVRNRERLAALEEEIESLKAEQAEITEALKLLCQETGEHTWRADGYTVYLHRSLYLKNIGAEEAIIKALKSAKLHEYVREQIVKPTELARKIDGLGWRDRFRLLFSVEEAWSIRVRERK